VQCRLCAFDSCDPPIKIESPFAQPLDTVSGIVELLPENYHAGEALEELGDEAHATRLPVFARPVAPEPRSARIASSFLLVRSNRAIMCAMSRSTILVAASSSASSSAPTAARCLSVAPRPPLVRGASGERLPLFGELVELELGDGPVRLEGKKITFDKLDNLPGRAPPVPRTLGVA
jgi:hypothetical protein